jgi:PurA ssDNA and RNA-binding protein
MDRRGGDTMDYDDNDGYQRRENNALHSEKLVGERKIFFLDLKENDRGRLIKITEDVRGRRDTIMLPIDMARDFAEALQRILEADAQTS